MTVTAEHWADFWAHIEDQLHRLETAYTVDEVLKICRPTPGLAASDADGFFAGSGGDGTVFHALAQAGWSVRWMSAGYHWCAEDRNGDPLTYVEGDLYRGNRRPMPAHQPL